MPAGQVSLLGFFSMGMCVWPRLHTSRKYVLWYATSWWAKIYFDNILSMRCVLGYLVMGSRTTNLSCFSVLLVSTNFYLMVVGFSSGWRRCWCIRRWWVRCRGHKSRRCFTYGYSCGFVGHARFTSHWKWWKLVMCCTPRTIAVFYSSTPLLWLFLILWRENPLKFREYGIFFCCHIYCVCFIEEMKGFYVVFCL